MRVFNTTPYAFLPFDCSPAPTLPATTVIVKGTFELRPDAPAAPLPRERQERMRGDEMHLDDLGRSLAYATDLVPSKPRAEVLVKAVCYSPDGRPRGQVDVAVEIGPIKKALRVTGDRIRVGDGVGRATPFESMPVRWERAYGGMSYAENPLGRGIEPMPDESGRPTHFLPNIEYADKKPKDAKDLVRPAGLGPISPAWEPRCSRQGTRDQRWAMFCAPLPPKDFSPAFHNAAPQDQQLATASFRGDEAIVMTGLHKERAVYRTALPGTRMRLFLHRRTPAGAPPRFEELPLHLDTVHVDMEQETLVLVWRRPVPLGRSGSAEIEAYYLAEEQLAEEPASLESHFARYQELRGPDETPVDHAAEAETAEAEAQAQLAEAKNLLREGKIDPKVLAEIEATSDPDQMFETLMSYAEVKIREMEDMTAKFKAMT